MALSQEDMDIIRETIKEEIISHLTLSMSAEGFGSNTEISISVKYQGEEVCHGDATLYHN